MAVSVRLFVTDLDGTLVPSGHEVSTENVRVVREAVQRGVVVTIATGRMYRATLPLAKKLGVDVPLITYNGALIKSVQGEVLYSSFLAPELIHEVIDFCRERGWHVQLFSEDMLYFAAENKYTDFYIANQQVPWNAVGWDGMKKQTRDVTKLLVISDGIEETNARIAQLREHFGDRISAVRSNPCLAEITNLGVSKAAALERLAEKLGIPMEETMAIGDSDNDVPMLKAAGKSVAMGNALPHIKEMADFVTGNCAEDGFAKAIYKYVLHRQERGDDYE